MSRYEVQERPRDGMAIINDQIWHRCCARKRNSCSVTGAAIYPGDLVYRPQTNGGNRMHRILATAVERRSLQP